MTSNDRQYRAFEFDVVDEESKIVEGRAVVFEQPTVLFEIDGVKYYEVIDRNAFNNANMKDVVFVENHEGTPGARILELLLQEILFMSGQPFTNQDQLL